MARINGELTNGSTGYTIHFVINKNYKNQLGAEGYELNVTAKSASITANGSDGIFYGVQTFLQLLPANLESKSGKIITTLELPVIKIIDYPRLGWRGLMLDVARHYFTVDEIKRYIDEMVRYKFNLLHLHLSDSHGWRIEIKSFPELVNVGAWRKNDEGNGIPERGGEKNYGGFYTQEQLKDIIKYAKERFVNIMPEIDVPAHSDAAIAAYPYLACGSKSALCPSEELVYDFIDKVVTEISALFPFEYLHMGGDEVQYNEWETDELKAFMKKMEIQKMTELQAYFENRVKKIVESKGKKMIGWDEIYEGKIDKSVAIMSWHWKGIQSGIEASNEGHKVVFSPWANYYLDLMQGDETTEIPVYETLRFKKVYQFDPVPPGANPANVLGAQGNLWTESINDFRQVQYMTWPRALAIAESVWSPKDKKHWQSFIQKTEKHFERLKYADIKYSTAIYEPQIIVKKEGNNYFVHLEPEIDNLEIFFTLDNSMPDNHSLKYNNPVMLPPPIEKPYLPNDKKVMRIQSYKNGRPVGRMISVKFDDLKKRIKG